VLVTRATGRVSGKSGIGIDGIDSFQVAASS